MLTTKTVELEIRELSWVTVDGPEETGVFLEYGFAGDDSVFTRIITLPRPQSSPQQRELDLLGGTGIQAALEWGTYQHGTVDDFTVVKLKVSLGNHYFVAVQRPDDPARWLGRALATHKGNDEYFNDNLTRASKRLNM